MRKSFWQFLGLFILLPSACAPSMTNQSATVIPSPSSTGTATSLPTITPTASTPALAPGASVTPLPTIPTFTPTFDDSTILTVTPAPKAECPTKGTAPQINFEIFPSGKKYVGHPTMNEFLEFLNSGGQLEQLDSELKQIDSPYLIEDITNDGISDLVIISGSAFQIPNILWCQDGQYVSFPKNDIEGETLGSTTVEFELEDLNRNGILEVISIGSGGSGFSNVLNVNVLEWNGETFVNLTSSESQINAWMENGSKDDIELVDLDNDGIYELRLKGLPNSWYYPGEPLRTQIDTYRWNGRIYSPSTTFSSPQYRFQAVQDADHEILFGEYEKAIILYQDIIFSDDLAWWSAARFQQNRTAALNFTAPPVLAPDETEYPRLAAYAYYRIMLLHLVQNHEADATTTYNTLQQTFDNDQYGHPYAEMATVFWEAYQSTHKMYDGCAAAIQYASEHPEILIPLGSDYHGWQSKIYKPEDVCPFR